MMLVINSDEQCKYDEMENHLKMKLFSLSIHVVRGGNICRYSYNNKNAICKSWNVISMNSDDPSISCKKVIIRWSDDDCMTHAPLENCHSFSLSRCCCYHSDCNNPPQFLFYSPITTNDFPHQYVFASPQCAHFCRQARKQQQGFLNEHVIDLSERRHGSVALRHLGADHGHARRPRHGRRIGPGHVVQGGRQNAHL